MSIPEHKITSVIGSSGRGKSICLKTLSRMNDLIDGVRIAGSMKDGLVLLDRQCEIWYHTSRGTAE